MKCGFLKRSGTTSKPLASGAVVTLDASLSRSVRQSSCHTMMTITPRNHIPFLSFTPVPRKRFQLFRFPTPYSPSLRVHYRIGDALGSGKGMFALTDLDTGDLIARERPLCLFPLAIPAKTYADVDAVIMQTLLKMKPTDVVDYFDLTNCKTEGGPASGIWRTNSLDVGRMPGEYDGIYTCICRDLSRVNHRSAAAYRLSECLTIITAALQMRLIDGSSKTLCMSSALYALSRKGKRFTSHMSIISGAAQLGKNVYSLPTHSHAGVQLAPYHRQKSLAAICVEDFCNYS